MDILANCKAVHMSTNRPISKTMCINKMLTVRWMLRSFHNDLRVPKVNGDSWRCVANLDFSLGIHSVSLGDLSRFCVFCVYAFEKSRARVREAQKMHFLYSEAGTSRTIPMWNSLPSSVVSCKTIEEFKAQI